MVVPDRWAHQTCLVQQKRLLVVLASSSFGLYVSVSYVSALTLALSPIRSILHFHNLFISGDTGWTGASPVSSGEKIMSLALIKAAHLMALGGGGWIMWWASLCLYISGTKEPVFDLTLPMLWPVWRTSPGEGRCLQGKESFLLCRIIENKLLCYMYVLLSIFAQP